MTNQYHDWLFYQIVFHFLTFSMEGRNYWEKNRGITWEKNRGITWEKNRGITWENPTIKRDKECKKKNKTYRNEKRDK